jgi:hypothetical protein
MAEKLYTEWERRYLAECSLHATCELVATVGDAVHADIAPLVAFHDAATRIGSNLPLA